MPFVRIDVVRGRDKAVLMRLVQEVSQVVARTLDTPIERVRVLVSEVDPDLWGIGGVPYSVARAPIGATGDHRPSSSEGGSQP